MQICTNMSWLGHLGHYHRGGGGGGGGDKVYNVMLHVNAATLRGLTSFNVVPENHSVQNSPWGVYSQLKA